MDHHQRSAPVRYSQARPSSVHRFDKVRAGCAGPHPSSLGLHFTAKTHTTPPCGTSGVTPMPSFDRGILDALSIHAPARLDERRCCVPPSTSYVEGAIILEFVFKLPEQLRLFLALKARK